MSTLTLSPPSSVDRKSPTPPNRAEDEGDSDGEIYSTDRATPVLPHGTSNFKKMSPAVAAQQQHQQQKSPPPAGVRNNAASRIALIKTAFEKTGPLKSSGKMNNRSSLSPVRRATSQQRSAFSNGGQDKKVWSSDHKNNHENDETLLALKNGGELVSRITSKLQELSTTATPPTSADGRPAIKKKPLLPPHKPSPRVNGHIVACNPELSRAQPSPTSFPSANCQLNGTAIQNGNSHRYSQAIKTATDSKFASSLPEVRSNKIVYDEGAGKKSSAAVQTEKGRPKSQTNNSAAALPPLTASINSADAPVSQHITRRSLPTSLGLLSSSTPELVPVSLATQAEHHNSDVSNANSTSEVSGTSADDAGLINNSGSAGDRSPIPELGLQEFRSHVERFHSARALFSNMEKQQTPTMPNAPLLNVSSPNKSPSKNIQTNVINTTDVGKTPVVSNMDVTTSTFPVILSTPLSSGSSVAASQVSLVKFMAQHYVEMIQQQSSPSSSNSNTSMQNQSINSGSVPLDADLLHQQHVAKVTDAANASAHLVAESVAVPISRADKTVSHGGQITDYDMQQSTIPEHLPAVRMAPVVDFQQHVVNSVLLASAASDNFDAANMLPNEDVVADDFQPVQRQFKRRLSFDTVSDDVAAHSDQQQEQGDTLRRSAARQQQRAEPPSSEFPVHHASHVDGSFPNSSHAMEDDLNTSFSTQYSTDSLNTSIQSSPHSGKQRMRQHQQQQQALAASLSSSFSTDNISSTSRTSKNLDELTLEDFADDDLALMSNEDRQQLFDRGVKTEESFALARRESLKGNRRGDSTKDKANISANDSLVMDSVVIAGDDGLTAEPYDSEMEAIDRLLDNDDLNSSNHMPWDEEEDELTPTTTPGEGTLTKQARKSFSPLPPVEDVHDGAAHSAERAEKFETEADEDREQEFSQYHVDVANSAEPTLFNIADVIGDTNRSRFKTAFEQYEVVNYREDGHYWVEVPGLQPEVDDDEIVGTDNDAESYNSGDENGDVTFVKNDAENIGEPTSAADSTFTADTQPADIILNDSSSYNKTKNHDALDYGRASIVNDGSGAAARLERAVLRHRAAAKVKFSSGPIRVYSTFTGDEYDRRNSAIDPVAASAEWELEKRIEKMDVFDCVMERGEDEGLGVAIIGMGVGADIGLEKLGIFIKRVNEGGPAARLSEPGIRVGDQLIEVDGQSLVGVSQAYAAQVLRACGPVVNFRVGRDKDEQGEIAQLITAARQRDQQQQQPQMMVEEHREDDYGESTSQVDDIDHSEMKSDDEDNVAGSRFSEAETDSLKSRNDDDDDDDAHAGEYDIESAEVRHEHRQNAAGTETSELEPVTVRVTPMDEDAVEYNVQSDSLTSPSATTTRSTSQDNYAEVKTTENMSSSAVGNKPPDLPNKLALPVLVQRKNASFDAGSGDATAGKPLDGIGGVAATAAADGSTNLNKLESLSNVSVASSVINGMLNDHSEDLERLQTLYEEALLRSQIAENEVDLLKDKLETVQKTQAAQAAVAAAAVSEEEQEQRRLQVDANERQVEQLRAAEERARAAQTVLEELKSQLNEKQSQLALVERKYQKAKRLMREFRHRMQSIERQYEERVKRLEIQLQEQRRGSSSGAATANGVTETVKNYADITDETADDDDDMSVTLSTDITMSDVSTLNRSIETNNVVVFKSSTTTTTTTSATKSQDIFAAPVLQQHDLLDATAARHRIELAYKGLLGQRQPPSRISYTASCSSDGGIADTNNNDIVNALAATSSSSSGKVGAEGMRLEQEVRALLLSGMQTAEKAVGDNIPPPAITTANSGENKPSLRGILPTSEAPPLPVKSGSLIARVTRAVQHQLHPSSVAPPTTKTATEVSSSRTTTATTGTKKEYKSMHPQYRPLPQIPLHNVNIGQPKTCSASSTNVAQNGSNVDDATSSQVITMETGQTYRVTRYSALGNNSSGNSSFLDTSLNISASGDSIGSKLDSSGSRYGSSSSPAAGAAGKSTFFYSPATAEINTPLPNAANVSPSLSNASSLTRRIIAVANNDVVSSMSPTNERRQVPASAALLKGREMAVDVPPSISTLPSSSLSRANTAAAAAAGSLETKAGGEGLQRDAGASSSSSSTLTQTASMASGGTVGSAALTQTPGSSLDAQRSTVAVATWTNHHIKQMLLSLGLAHHVAAFEANGIDGNKLLEIGLDSEKLKQIGVFDRHERHLIKKKVKELRIVLARERRAMQRTRAAREQRQQQQQHAMLLESLMPPMPLVLASAVPPDSPSILKAESSSMPPVLSVPLTKSASTTASSATAAIKRRLLGRGRQSRTSADGANAITASGSSVGSTTSSTAAAASVALNAKKKTRSASAQPVAASSAKVSKTTATRNGDAAVQVKEH